MFKFSKSLEESWKKRRIWFKIRNEILRDLQKKFKKFWQKFIKFLNLPIVFQMRGVPAPQDHEGERAYKIKPTPVGEAERGQMKTKKNLKKKSKKLSK